MFLYNHGSIWIIYLALYKAKKETAELVEENIIEKIIYLPFGKIRHYGYFHIKNA